MSLSHAQELVIINNDPNNFRYIGKDFKGEFSNTKRMIKSIINTSGIRMTPQFIELVKNNYGPSSNEYKTVSQMPLINLETYVPNLSQSVKKRFDTIIRSSDIPLKSTNPVEKVSMTEEEALRNRLKDLGEIEEYGQKELALQGPNVDVKLQQALVELDRLEVIPVQQAEKVTKDAIKKGETAMVKITEDIQVATTAINRPSAPETPERVLGLLSDPILSSVSSAKIYSKDFSDISSITGLNSANGSMLEMPESSGSEIYSNSGKSGTSSSFSEKSIFLDPLSQFIASGGVDIFDMTEEQIQGEFAKYMEDRYKMRLNLEDEAVINEINTIVRNFKKDPNFIGSSTGAVDGNGDNKPPVNEIQNVGSVGSSETNNTTPFAVDSVQSHPVKYHKNSILFYFGSIENPDWDLELEKNVYSAKMTKEEIVEGIDAIIMNYGSTLFVYGRESESLDEFHELIQLQFCYIRNLQRGTRSKQAMVPISSLTSFANKLAGVSVTQTQGPQTDVLDSVSVLDQPVNQPIVQTPFASQIQGTITEEPVKVPISKNEAIQKVVDAYNNSKYDLHGKPVIDPSVVSQTKVHFHNILGQNSKIDVCNQFVPAFSIKTSKIKTAKVMF